MTPALVWDLVREAPELLRHLPPGTLPLHLDPPTSIAPFREATRVRPPGHRRAFYELRDRGVIAWKGTEPTAADFADWVAEMVAQRLHVEVTFGPVTRDVLTSRAELRALDKWSLVEGKVPGGYTVREGIAEARAAARYQRVHLERYGELARIPVPLAVYRWPDEVQARVETLLRPHLSPRFGAIEPLGCYAYAYPSLPLRLIALPVRDPQRGFGYRARLAALELAPRAIVERWIDLVARMLASGFVPKDPTAVTSGDCLQLQNMVLDGGVADVESLIPTGDLDERALADTIRRAVSELSTSVVRLLGGLQLPTPQVRERLPDLGVHVWRDVAKKVAADRPVDPRVLSFLEPASAWDGLDRVLSLLLP